jgi:hypothetical protein
MVGLVSLALLTGCAGRGPLAQRDRGPVSFEREGVPHNQPAPFRAEGPGVNPMSLTPAADSTVTTYHDPYDGFEIALPPHWTGVRGPFGARLTGPQQMVGEVLRLEGNPTMADVLPKGCRIAAARAVNLRAGPGDLAQLRCVRGTGTEGGAAISPGEYERVHILFRAEGRSYLFWLRSDEKANLATVAQQVANNIAVHP